MEVTRGNLEPMPIAIPAFVGAGGGVDELSQNVAQVLTADLKRSGLFAPIDPAAFIERVVSPSVTPNFANWRPLNAQALVTGSVTSTGDGRIMAEYRLWDVFAGQYLAGKQFYASPENWRRLAHIIADSVYERLTGEKGYFDTRVAFVDETGGKAQRVKRLAIMDQDGANVRYLTNGSELVLTPRFSPSRQELVYASLTGDQWHVFLLNIESGQRELIGNFPNMSFSPRFSPDGQQVVLSLEQGGNANIYRLDLRTRQLTRLTDSPSIDTAPSFSPDGSQIVFESDRGGQQQLYVMSAGGGAGAAHQLRPGPLRHAGLVAARRRHRLHQAGGRQLQDRRHQAGRLGRAHPDRGLPQRRPDLGAERPRADVLPRLGWGERRPAALVGRHHRL